MQTHEWKVSSSLNVLPIPHTNLSLRLSRAPVLVVEGNQNHRVRAGIEGQPFCRTGLAIADRLIHFRECLHVTAMKQRMDLLLEQERKASIIICIRTSYIRPSSSSIASAQVEAEGSDVTATPRFFAISSRRP